MDKDFNKDRILEEAIKINRAYLDTIASNESLKDLTIKMQTECNYLYSNFKSIFQMSNVNQKDLVFYRRSHPLLRNFMA